MAEYRVLVTDLTEYGDLRCVAGVNLTDKKMIRPEPSPGDFWPSNVGTPKGPFIPGNVVVFDATSPKPPTDFPHLTEDMVVQGNAEVKRTVEWAKFIQALRRLHSPLDTIFGKYVEFSNGKPYIRTGTRCPSLYGTNVPASAIQFHEAYEKPRINLIQGDLGANLSITALDLKEMYRSKGLEAITARFKSAEELHLRIGLARGFRRYPDRCYMQINGIYVLK